MNRLLLLVVLGLAPVVASRASAAEPTTAADWKARLPANKWAQIDEKKSGNRVNAQVI